MIAMPPRKSKATQTKSAKKKKNAAASPVPRHGNRSIVVGVALLKCIAGFGRSSSLGEIARAIDMSPTRTHRYLLGLINAGLVEQNALSQRYDLGVQVVELGVLALGRADSVRLANEALLGLSKACNAPALVVVWGTNGPTVIRCEQAENPSMIRVREGRNLSLLKSSSGRVFLTYVSAPLVDSLLKTELAKGKETAAVPDPETLKEDVRRQGIGRSQGEEDEHLVSISAPVFDANGALTLCITLLNIRGWLDTNPDGEPAKLLRQTADNISRRLGAGRRTLT